MRVVFLTHNYPRHPGDVAGAFLHPLARALLARGHDVRVVAPSDRGAGGRAELDGIPVRRVRYARPEREIYGYSGRMAEAARSPRGLVALLDLVLALKDGAEEELAGSADEGVIHAHWWIPAGLATPAPARTVVTLHGTDGQILERSRAGRILGRWALRRAAVITVVSDELAQIVAARTGRADVGARVQGMPIPEAGRPWTTGGEGALVVARLTSQKRVELALQALARLPADLSLTIAGDGPERPALERLAAALGVGKRVTFLGTITPEEVAQRLARADVLLFPAVGEGLGLAAIEALMAGVPVVACRDGGGVVGALERFGGGIVTDPEAAALADAIGRAVQDAGCRAAAREAGTHWRAELAPDRVAAVHERWYQEALRAGMH